MLPLLLPDGTFKLTSVTSLHTKKVATFMCPTDVAFKIGSQIVRKKVAIGKTL